MTFKAKIEKVFYPSTIGTPPAKSKYNQFKFTKSKILFTRYQEETVYFLGIPLTCPIKDRTKYTFHRIVDGNDKKRFLIRLNDNITCSGFLEINWWNRLKCNLMHKRYWLWKSESNWLKQAVIT